MSKFTKGPYEVNDSGLIYGQVSGDADEAPFVADCCNDPGSGIYTAREKATAELLASSWDLLAALERLTLEAEKRAGVPQAEIRAARSAITKARGGAA